MSFGPSPTHAAVRDATATEPSETAGATVGQLPFSVSDALPLSQVFAPALNAARQSSPEPPFTPDELRPTDDPSQFTEATTPRLAGLIIEQRRLLDRLQAIGRQRERVAAKVPLRSWSPDEIVAAIAHATSDRDLSTVPPAPEPAPHQDAERPPMIIERALAERERAGPADLPIIAAEPPLYSVASFLVGLSLAALISFALYLGLRAV